jgi:hypothetical protein
MKLYHFPFAVFAWPSGGLAAGSFFQKMRASNYLRKGLGPLRKQRCLKAGQVPFDSATMVMLRFPAPIRLM